MALVKDKKIKVADIKPKLDHNLSIAGLLLTDSDTLSHKLEKAREGILKGLLVFNKKIPSGEVYIANGVEFPNADAVDLLLYLIWCLEKNDWVDILQIESLNKVVKDVFGVKKLGEAQKEKLKRLLTIWKFHGYYFPNSFIWKGQKITLQFGVISNWKIVSRGRGRPSLLEIEFDRHFIEICKNTDWYRRPNWMEVRKLRKEIAKSLYLLALDYRPSKSSTKWRIYIRDDLKDWYRNTFNSLANPKHLYPKLIIEKRLKPAIMEINTKTNLLMEFKEAEEGNYCIEVKEKVKKVKSDDSDSDKAVKIRIPFDELGDEEKSLLISYVARIADEKGIKNIWGFLRSMNVNQIKTWLGKAKKYFGIEDKEEEKEEEKALYVEKPELIETLLEWGKGRFKSESMYKLYFGKGNIVGAYEGKGEVLFICRDNVLARLIEKNKIDKELAGVFGKKVIFVGKDSVEVENLISKQSG